MFKGVNTAEADPKAARSRAPNPGPWTTAQGQEVGRHLQSADTECEAEGLSEGSESTAFSPLSEGSGPRKS